MTGCGKQSINGKGDAKQERREIKSFSGVDVDGIYIISGTIGQPNELVISSNPNILPYIKSSIDSDILTIKYDDSVKLAPSVQQTIWFTTDNFQTLNLSGNTQFQMTDVNGKQLVCKLNGSHKVFLRGKLDSLKMVINGKANINAEGLNVKDADLEINGSAIIGVQATDNLKVKINGDGKVMYYGGQPKVQQTIHGSGQVISAFGNLEQQKNQQEQTKTFP